jgi:hypothetical protein
MRLCIGIFIVTTGIGILIHDYRLHAEQQARRDAIDRKCLDAEKGLQEFYLIGREKCDCQSRYLRAVLEITRALTTRDATGRQDERAVDELLAADAALRQAEQREPRRDELRRQFSILDDPNLTAEENELERSVLGARKYVRKLGL